MPSNEVTQDVVINGVRYHVSIKQAKSGDVLGSVSRDGKSVYSEMSFETEDDAKLTLHRWTYFDAGIWDHRCDANCESWRKK